MLNRDKYLSRLYVDKHKEVFTGNGDYCFEYFPINKVFAVAEIVRHETLGNMHILVEIAKDEGITWTPEMMTQIC